MGDEVAAEGEKAQAPKALALYTKTNVLHYIVNSWHTHQKINNYVAFARLAAAILWHFLKRMPCF